jgi:anti-sigma regulatory factor (Ser/Thr protein kinase)
MPEVGATSDRPSEQVMRMSTAASSTISGDARSIPGARRMVRALTARYRADLAETAELLTDELVTNAVMHGGGRFTVRASIDPERLRVTVSDRWGSSPVTVFDPGHDRESGRGLTIVEAMASRWGIERHDSEKWIWFEIELPA